jgi:outer membrane protein OmpA-like peptidoglycan-associated protein
MLGTRLVIPRRGRDEGEKPFWISYADLMTALMMLFLVVMAVALFAITSRNDRHEEEIDACLKEAKHLVAGQPGVELDIKNRRVSFGERARFANREYNLSIESAQQLREFAPVMLEFADSSCGRKLLRRVVVEGYTSQVGSYLYNLNLSLNRAHSVLCALYDRPEAGEQPLTDDQKQRIRELFLVGGYSSNSARATDEESRRVELKLEFWSVDERGKSPVSSTSATNLSPLGQCQLQRHAVAN